MTWDSAHELLEALLREEVPTEAELLAFLGSKAANEGLYLDFKHGMEFGKPKKARNLKLREYVAAFANSEGGVLIVGVEDKTMKLAPITNDHEKRISGEHKGGQDLKAWATRVVSNLVGYLGVPPRFHVVDVEGGKVFLVAVARAPTLVPLHHEGRIKHFFRIEDETREVPSSLVADLVLGRRQTPFLKVTATRWELSNRLRDLDPETSELGPQGSEIKTKVRFLITNESLVTAKSLRAGILLWHFDKDRTKSQPISGDLLARITSERPPQDEPFHRLTHLLLEREVSPSFADDPYKRGLTLRPFETFSVVLSSSSTWSFIQRDAPDLEPCAALYLLPDGGEPLWFEVRLPVYGLRIQNPSTVEPILARVLGRRPLVSLTAKREAA